MTATDHFSSQRPAHPVALVVGASGGLGQAIAVELDDLGCALALHCHASEDAARMLQEKLHNDAMVLRADIGSWSEVEAVYERITDHLGTVDVLVNCAAVRQDGLMAMQSPAVWRSVIDTNLVGTFHTCRVAVTRMLRQRWGRIINVVSPSGIIASPGQTAYSASKAGVIGLTRTLASECGRRGVTVNALSPGFMETYMTDDVPEQFKEVMRSRLPVPRFTSPAEVARSMGFFLDNDYLTGQVVSIDGGISIT